jgi:hypothetical protein
MNNIYISKFIDNIAILKLVESHKIYRIRFRIRIRFIRMVDTYNY